MNAVSSLAFVVMGLLVLRWSRRGLTVAMSGALVVAGVGSFGFHGVQAGWSHPIHDVGVVLVVVVPVIVMIDAVRRDTIVVVLRRVVPWVGLLLFGFAVYLAGRTGAPWCDPGSAFQPHAVWHVLAAIALAGITVTARSRSPIP